MFPGIHNMTQSYSKISLSNITSKKKKKKSLN